LGNLQAVVLVGRDFWGRLVLVTSGKEPKPWSLLTGCVAHPPPGGVYPFDCSRSQRWLKTVCRWVVEEMVKIYCPGRCRAQTGGGQSIRYDIQSRLQKAKSLEEWLPMMSWLVVVVVVMVMVVVVWLLVGRSGKGAVRKEKEAFRSYKALPDNAVPFRVLAASPLLWYALNLTRIGIKHRDWVKQTTLEGDDLF
jgi:hypothetical protein